MQATAWEWVTAPCRSPRRPRSEMSSTTTTSADSISLAARSERSAPGGSRKSNRSGIGVGLAIPARSPRARRRCHSATSLRSEEHTSELQSRLHLVCRLLLEKKKENKDRSRTTTRDEEDST